MQKQKKLSTASALVIVLMAFGAFVTAVTVVTKNQLGTTFTSRADDSENDSESDSEDSSNSDSQESSSESASKSAEKASESVKKQAERTREAAKKAAEGSRVGGDDNEKNRTVSNNDSEEMDADGDFDGDGNDEDGDSTNGMFRDRVKTVSKLEEEIAKAEQEILKKQAEGMDVTAALARLAQAKVALGSVGGAFDANNLEEVKRLGQEVNKLAHSARNEDIHDAGDITEKVAKIARRITQTEGKIVLFEAVGGDGSQFKSSLAGVASDFSALKATVSAGGSDFGTSMTALEVLEKKVKTIKNSVENAIYALGGTDSRYDDDYKNETDDIVEHLKKVADIRDDNVGEAVRGLAKDQEASAQKVGDTVAAIDQHNRILQLLFGTNPSNLRSLEQEIAANKKRAAALTQAANVMEDQDLKQILLDQVETLNQETSKLETFVGGQRDRLSAFGWFFNLFSK